MDRITQSYGRNSEVELLRFLFSVCVMIFHYNADYQLVIFKNGFIGVEFFFLISGVLMGAAAAKETSRGVTSIGYSTAKFLRKKILAFYPCYICAIIFQLVFRLIIVEHWPMRKLGIALLQSIPSLLCIQMCGFDLEMGITGDVVWYLSAMILAMAVLFPFLLFNYDLSARILCPLVGLFILGSMSKQFGTIAALTGDGLIYNGMKRAVGEICIGVWINQLVSDVSQVNFTSFAHKLSKILKILVFSLVFLYAAGILELQTYIVFMLIAIGVLIIHSEVGQLIHRNNKVCIWLGKLSLPIYLIHSPVKGTLRGLGMQNAYASMSISLLAAICLMYFVSFLRKNANTLSKLFIKQ